VRLLNRLSFRWRALVERRRLEEELREELEQHLEYATARHVKRGLGPDAARRAARLEFGSLESAAEECRES